MAIENFEAGTGQLGDEPEAQAQADLPHTLFDALGVELNGLNFPELPKILTKTTNSTYGDPED